ncbi:MAG: EAL domain-containing protein, partial [Leptospiraceae bacterium]|nr:EAL domain-containing protein [Leptospiraceae bacterium]
VLGRLQIGDKILSLGGFFADPSISRLFKKEIDRVLRKKAIQLFASQAPHNTKLFLNFSPRLLQDYTESSEDELLFLLQIMREFRLNPERIIIEITEDSFEGRIESLQSIIEEYKKRGFSFAIDDVGSNASNLDRIGTLEPDIIKIDMQLLKKSVVNRSYYEINLNLSQLAQSLGISLLYEGIETQSELNKCLNFGASLLQGFFFQEPQSFFYDCGQFTPKITKHISEALEYKKKSIENLIQWEQKIEALLDSFNIEDHLKENGQIVEYESIFTMDSRIKRLYVTDQYGNQLSPNYTKTAYYVRVDSDAIGKNWSWRPYFSNHIYESVKYNNQWVISPIYKDILNKILMRTLSRNLSNGNILFIDVIYEEE